MSESETRRSIAIAGAWGYIGRKFIDAARVLEYDIYVHDPGPVPGDLTPGVKVVDSAADFYALDVDLFHLALHPEHRGPALDALLPRALRDGIVILNEKPMAAPEAPDDCGVLVERVARSGAALLFDFPELFDPITDRVVAYLDGFDEVEIHEVRIQRSKDREDPENPRNLKKMVPIQYQESVHCVAFLLNLLGSHAGSVEAAVSEGISVRAQSDPYDAPNPEAYTYVVDGRCDFEMQIGKTKVIGHTDFKREAPWRKERIIRGVGDGNAFEIQMDFLEGAKYLLINGEDQRFEPWASSYTAVLRGIERQAAEVPHDRLMTGVYANPAFARYTYQLSSALWRASRDGETIALNDAEALIAFDARFAEDLPNLPTYA